ncbi:hypothetical protein BP6252_10584 [Coleophoma cylindrospora]|uniref:GPR1 protein n=1 Tax=Coleophoma cylindrospora TaxID=1849047 RepID=A0A3D8QSZ6_9HELO|nr:hypothetical protein BP6252_10584 [Coleophoma cylindrospora]
MADHQEDFYSKESINGSKEQRVGNGSSHLEDLKRTTTNITLSPDQFEKLYLSPQNRVSGDLRKTLANPTPLGLLGFTIALTPLSAELMGWRGAAGFNATIGANYFFGGLLLIIASVLEFFLGNTFPSTVFAGYGAHFLTFAATFQPAYAAISAYTTDGSATQTPPFQAAYGFYTISMAMLSTIFLVCSFRTNVVFVLIFTCADLGFILVTGAFWQLAQGNAAVGSKLLVGTGACFFGACVAGWYLLFVIMIATVDMPFSLPVGDLSTLIKGASDRAKMKKNQE